MLAAEVDRSAKRGASAVANQIRKALEQLRGAKPLPTQTKVACK
jgi:hypothetical protein